MENQNDDSAGLTNDLKAYIETTVKIVQFEAIDKATSFFASLATNLIVLVCIVLTFLFGTVTVALLLGKLLNSYWEGFGIVTLIYLLAALLIAAIKQKYIQPRIVNFLIHEIFKNKD